MIDFHTHTLLSDGQLLPSELIRRAFVKGYKVIGITDHADESNIDYILPRLVKVCKKLENKIEIRVIPGVELTHIQPSAFPDLVKYARNNGSKIVIGHGETIVEPVITGTNRAAIEAKVDILAHPGIISLDDAKIASELGVSLEITARSGHSLSNGHVAKIALEANARLVLDTDSHSPDNLITMDQARNIAIGAGLSLEYFEKSLQNNMKTIADACLA